MDIVTLILAKSQGSLWVSRRKKMVRVFFWGSFTIVLVGKNAANQLRLVVYPIIYKVLYIPGGAELLPSTVAKGAQWRVLHLRRQEQWEKHGHLEQAIPNFGNHNFPASLSFFAGNWTRIPPKGKRNIMLQLGMAAIVPRIVRLADWVVFIQQVKSMTFLVFLDVDGALNRYSVRIIFFRMERGVLFPNHRFSISICNVYF